MNIMKKSLDKQRGSLVNIWVINYVNTMEDFWIYDTLPELVENSQLKNFAVRILGMKSTRYLLFIQAF